MKLILLLSVVFFSFDSSAYQCPLDPKLSKAEQEEYCRKGSESYAKDVYELSNPKKDCFIDKGEALDKCYPNVAAPAEIEELKALGRAYSGTEKIPPRVHEICRGQLKCQGIFLWERNNREPGKANPLTDYVSLTRLETDMRLQQKCNCQSEQKFPACAYYKQYLEQHIPETRFAICAAIGCEKNYDAMKLKREEYLRLRVPEDVFKVAAKYSKAFIDPITAGDEYRAYVHITGLNPGLENIARDEFKDRLCRREKQALLGSDHAQCELFVDDLIQSGTGAGRFFAEKK